MDSTPTNDWDGGDCEDENCHGLDGVLQTCTACCDTFYADFMLCQCARQDACRLVSVQKAGKATKSVTGFATHVSTSMTTVTANVSIVIPCAL
jgi:hypothetical protein